MKANPRRHEPGTLRLWGGRALLLALLTMASPARAEMVPEVDVLGEEVLARGANLKWGALEFHPYIAVEGSYNDNVLLEHTHVSTDWITTYAPGISILLPFGNHAFDLKYQLFYKDYEDMNGLDGDQHTAEARLRLDFNRFYVNVSDRFAKLQDPVDIQFTDQIKRVANDADLAAGVRLGRWTIEGGGGINVRRYEDDPLKFLDYDEYKGSVEAAYSINPRTKVFIRDGFHRIHYIDEVLPDYWWNAATVGMRGIWTDKLSWDGGIGFAYAHAIETRPLTINEKKTDRDLYAKLGITWTIKPERTDLKLEYERSPAPSTISTFMVNQLARMTFRHRFTKQFSATLTASYETAKRSSGPNLSRWSYAPGVQYRFRDWAMIFARYYFQSFESDTEVTDYKNNIVTLGFILAF